MFRPVTPDAYRRYVPGFDKRRLKKDVVGGGRVGLRKKKRVKTYERMRNVAVNCIEPIPRLVLCSKYAFTPSLYLQVVPRYP